LRDPHTRWDRFFGFQARVYIHRVVMQPAMMQSVNAARSPNPSPSERVTSVHACQHDCRGGRGLLSVCPTGRPLNAPPAAIQQQEFASAHSEASALSLLQLCGIAARAYRQVVLTSQILANGVIAHLSGSLVAMSLDRTIH